MTPDWAIAEKAEHARQHADALCRIRRDALWCRQWTAYVGNARRTSPFARRYDAILDAGMAPLDAEWEAEGGYACH